MDKSMEGRGKMIITGEKESQNRCFKAKRRELGNKVSEFLPPRTNAF